MKKWLSNLVKTYFIAYFPFIVVFTASLYAPSDSDLGWHLKYGEYFYKNHTILRENIYSTMMAGYHWINSSWATDLLIYTTFRRFGFIGLSILGAIVITAIFYFFAKAAKLTFWDKAVLFPLLLYMEKPFFEVSFRGQLLSLLGTGILYFLLSEFEQGKKHKIFLTIPLFFVWSNFHGQFLLGLGLFFLWSGLYLGKNFYIARSSEKKTQLLHDGKILISSFLLGVTATLINPFGIGVLTESLRHFGNPLQKYIVEWIPFERFSIFWWNLIFWDILFLASLYILRLKGLLWHKIHYVIPTLLLLVFSFFVRRYTWSMLLVSLPVVCILVSYLRPKLAEVSGTIACMLLVFVYIWVIIIKAPKDNIMAMSWDRFCYQYVGCSPASAEFLSEKKYQGKMLTFYNWGGWLIWNYPQIKPSIDGRMHLWRDEKGYSAFAEYYPYEQSWKNIDASDYDVVYMTPKKPLYQKLAGLVKEDKWEIAYQDNYAAVFVRKTHLPESTNPEIP